MACLGIFYNVATSILIFNELKKRGIKESIFWLRMKSPVYAHQYKKVTMAESGKAGPLFYHWVISINAALILAIAAIIIMVVK